MSSTASLVNHALGLLEKLTKWTDNNTDAGGAPRPENQSPFSKQRQHGRSKANDKHPPSLLAEISLHDHQSFNLLPIAKLYRRR